MKDFKSKRKPGGFGGGNKFKGGGGRGNFSRPERSGPGGGDRGASRGNFNSNPMFKAVCSECGKDCQVPFRPTGTKPVLCSYCFAEQQGGGAKSQPARGNSFEAGAEKHMFKAICGECGSPCEVPFRPVGGKTVLCSDCFHGNGAPASKPAEKPVADYKVQLDALNAKLDKIIAMLTPVKAVESEVKAAVEKVVKEAKVPAKPVKVAKTKKVAEPKAAKAVKKKK